MKRWAPAAIQGALAGLIYGLIEYALVIVAPMLRWRPCSLVPDHWLWSAAFLLVYAVLGALIGGLAFVFRVAKSPGAAARTVAAAAAFALAAGRLAGYGISAADQVVEASYVLIALGIIIGISRPRRTWIWWISSPWVTLFLLLTIAKLREQFPGVLALLLSISGLCIIAAAVVWLASRSGALGRVFAHRSLPLTAWGVGAVVLVSTSLWLDARPPIPPGGTQAAGAPKRPNVLLIVLDTVRADHMSLYGYARQNTPILTDLARESVVFDDAVAASDMTLSSHGSMFTGLYPSWHRAHLIPVGDPPPLDPSFRTLAEILSGNGYTTMAVLANCAYLRPVFRLDQGFQLYDVRTPVSGVEDGRFSYLRDFIYPVLKSWFSATDLERGFRRADQITDDGLHILQAMREASAPFFLNLNYMDAHDPYLPPAPYRDFFPGRNPVFPNHRIHELRRALARSEQPSTLAADLAHITSQYDGAIAYLDAEVGRLLNGLKEAGQYDNTLIIVTSDHGEALGERSALGHPESVHRELVGVPLLIKYPRSTGVAAHRVNSPVSGVDLLPTILDVAGIPIPPNLHGESLRSLNPDSGRLVISESFPDSLSRLRGRRDLVQRALYQGTRKLVVSTSGQTELYDLAADPRESRNLYRSGDPTASTLNAALQSWILRIPAFKAKVTKIDHNTAKALRGLGYLQ